MDQPLKKEIERLIERAERHAAQTLVDAVALSEQSNIGSENQSIALRAAGIAAREMGQLPRARRLFDQSIEAALDAASGNAEGEALVCRAALAAIEGDTQQALADLQAAEPVLSGGQLAHVAVQRAAVVHQAGELEDATFLYGQALELTRRHGLELEEARVLSNRGLLGVHRSRFAQAENDLRAAAAIYERHDHPDMLLFVEHNLGYLAMCRGDLPKALSFFESVRNAALASGTDPLKAASDRSQALLAAGLTADAERESLDAAGHYAKQGIVTLAADAYIVAGQAALAARAPDRAVGHLNRALTLFPTQSRLAWQAVATSLLVAAHADAPRATPDSLGPSIESAIATLDHQAMPRYAMQARLADIRLQLASGDYDKAKSRQVEIEAVRRNLPPDLQIEYWRSVGELAARTGNRAGALRAFGHGMSWNRRLRRTLPWIETSTSPGPAGAWLAESGLRTTLEAKPRRAEAVLRWIESRYESTPLSGGAGSYAPDAEIEQVLAEARAAASELDERLREDEQTEDVVSAERRLRRLERRVASVNRLRKRSAPDDQNRRPRLRELLGLLGDRDLLELTDLDGQLYAVTSVGGKLRLHELGPMNQLVNDMALVRSSLRRVWADEAAVGQLSKPLERLDRMLIPPALARSDRPLVIVGNAELDALPLAVLPSLQARAISLAPSLGQFIESSASPAPIRHGATFVAGPNLLASTYEAEQASKFYTDSSIIAGADATGQRVLDRLDVAVAHFACHGRLRHDNPMFSSLDLADGPLPVHALQQAKALPHTAILSACNVGRSGNAGTDHVLGLPAALLALGVRAVVASCLEVPDAITAEVMIGFHKKLSAGSSPADALAEMRGTGDREANLVASTFSCHGG